MNGGPDANESRPLAAMSCCREKSFATHIEHPHTHRATQRPQIQTRL
jgi:hypothetical protein